jgi:predicted HAD superfamily Cof-like phosphohydrolase
MFEDIKDFHQRFKLTYEGGPRQLPPDLRSFRVRFLVEELTEYILADKLEDQLDGLVDLVYVALGTAYLHGFDFDTAWQRVHMANMLKRRAQRPSDSKRGSVEYDIVKPEGWRPPDLSDLVDDDSLRQTGRTTQQLIAAPLGALFVWPHKDYSYLMALIKSIRRHDIWVTDPSKFNSWVSHHKPLFNHVILDHAVTLSPHELEFFLEMLDYYTAAKGKPDEFPEMRFR